MKLSALLIRWREARAPTPKAIVAAEKAVASFTSYVGDIGIGEITADDCFEFRDALVVMPASMTRAERLLPFAELVRRYENRTDVERVKPASVKKYLGAIQALLGFAFQERFVTINVSAGIKVENYGKSSDRRPFSKEELASLFAAPLFVQPWSSGRRRKPVSDTTLRWLFLFGLCTGGRLEELGQILVPDVKQADGVWYIDVTAHVSSDRGNSELAPSKRVKTASSVRVIPLHPKLVEMGFVDYILRLRAAKTVKLFEDLRPDSLSVQTKEASRLAARVIDKAVSTDPRIVFHSFRHTFKDLCRNAGIPKDVHDQLTGHAPADVGGSYGLGHAIVMLADHMRRIDLRFIDWAAIMCASKV
jgi:integrase